MEHTKKIGIILGLYIQIASNDQYANKIYKETKIDDGTIEFKKEFIYEKDMHSKTIIMYSIKREADNIDQKLMQIKNPRIQYISFKQSTVEKRISTIHTNVIINIKVWFETLYNIRKNTKVKYKENISEIN